MQIREQLEQVVDAAISAAMSDGSLALEQAPAAALERPRDAANGDWASTVAMRSAKLAHSLRLSSTTCRKMSLSLLPKLQVLVSSISV